MPKLLETVNETQREETSEGSRRLLVSPFQQKKSAKNEVLPVFGVVDEEE